MAILPAFDDLQQFILLIIDYFSTKKNPIFANESLNVTNNSVVRVTIYCHQQCRRVLLKLHCILLKVF